MSSMYSEKCSKHVFKKTNVHHVYKQCSTCVNKMLHVYIENAHSVLDKWKCLEQKSN